MRRMTIVLALLIGVACAKEPTSPGDELVGTYSLLSIEGQPLPYSYVDAGKSVTMWWWSAPPWSIQCGAVPPVMSRMD